MIKETKDYKKGLDLLSSKDVLLRDILIGIIRYGRNEAELIMKGVSYTNLTYFMKVYQSYMWNTMARYAEFFRSSYRYEIYGLNVLMGDLIMEKDEIGIVSSENIKNIRIEDILIPIIGYSSIIKLRSKAIIPANEFGDYIRSYLRENTLNSEEVSNFSEYR